MNKKINTKLSEAMHLQAIEDNPLDVQDIAMFAMFEKKEFSPKQRRAYILAQVDADTMITAAE